MNLPNFKTFFSFRRLVFLFLTIIVLIFIIEAGYFFHLNQKRTREKEVSEFSKDFLVHRNYEELLPTAVPSDLERGKENLLIGKISRVESEVLYLTEAWWWLNGAEGKNDNVELGTSSVIELLSLKAEKTIDPKDGSPRFPAANDAVSESISLDDLALGDYIVALRLSKATSGQFDAKIVTKIILEN